MVLVLGCAASHAFISSLARVSYTLDSLASLRCVLADCHLSIHLAISSSESSSSTTRTELVVFELVLIFASLKSELVDSWREWHRLSGLAPWHSAIGSLVTRAFDA